MKLIFSHVHPFWTVVGSLSCPLVSPAPPLSVISVTICIPVALGLVSAGAHWCNVPGMQSEVRLGRSVFLNSHTGSLAGDPSSSPTTYCLSWPRECPQKYICPPPHFHSPGCFFCYYYCFTVALTALAIWHLYALGRQTFKGKHSSAAGTVH